MPNAVVKRSYTGTYFQLMLDGSEPAGLVKSVDYGGIKGELLAQPVGGQPWKVKHIHNPTIEPITIQIGMSMSKSFFDWVAKSWAGDVERRSGSIITYNANFEPVFEYQFKEALILETTIPTLDASNKEAAFLTVKFQPETGEYLWEPGGKAVRPRVPAAQKLWSPANFRLEIDGLDVGRVAKIEQFVVKQNVKPMSCGPDWMYQIEPTSLEYPNLSVSLAMVSAQPWFDWHKQFVIDGQNGPDNEKTGAITFLTPDLNEELLTIDLRAVGLVNVALEKSDATSANMIRRVKAELYCEEMGFTVHPPRESQPRAGAGANQGAAPGAGPGGGPGAGGTSASASASGAVSLGGISLSGSVSASVSVSSDGSVSGEASATGSASAE